MSEKLDGVRCYWNGKQLLSRLGHEFHAPAWFTKYFPPNVCLDGELWIGRGQFNDTVSIVRTKEPNDGWAVIEYRVFDVPSHTGPLEARLDYLHSLVHERICDGAIDDVVHRKCYSKEHLQDELKRIEGLGGEGLMLRQPGSTYVGKRSSTLLKVKSFKDTEALVVDHYPGKGKHLGRLGKLICQLPNGIQFGVGTGFSDKERENPPPIGSTITFKYKELTPAGVPRFPTFLRIYTP